MRRVQAEVKEQVGVEHETQQLDRFDEVPAVQDIAGAQPAGHQCVARGGDPLS